MSEKEVAFSGPVQVYLQGERSLSLHRAPTARSVSYYLGAPASDIRLRDFRRLPLQAVRGGLLASSFERFASLFNGPARVEIVNLPHGAEIQLHDPDLTDEAGQILWLGVLDHGWVPAPDAEWEILRPLGGERTAFAALVAS